VVNSSQQISKQASVSSRGGAIYTLVCDLDLMTNGVAVEQDPDFPSGEHNPEVLGCVSIIIPVFNEINSINKLLQRVKSSAVHKQIIVVDDGSTDGTREALAEARDHFAVTAVFHQDNRGKGAAIRTGLRHARGEFVLIQDADLEYDPSDYPALLEPLRLGLANVVYGVRPDRPERGFFYYHGAKFLTVLTNLLYRCNIQDEATCYKAFRRSTLNQVRLKCRRFEFCPEVTAKLSRIGEKIWEVPISYSPRTAGEGKKIRWSDGLLAAWTLLRYRIQPRRRFIRAARAEKIRFEKQPLGKN
jgi:dolichol-phosphate mannosyltransferase